MPDPTPPEPIEPPITRVNTAATFLKAHGHDPDEPEPRLGPGAVELLTDLVNRLALLVTRKAADLAREDSNRTTLLEKDIRAAYDSLVWTEGSGTPAGPDLLFSHIDRLPTDQLASLVRRINDWLASQVHGNA